MRFLVFVLAVAATLSSVHAQEKKTVTIAVSGPPAQLYFLPVMLAKGLGHFDQAGVSVELQHFNAGSRAGIRGRRQRRHRRRCL
ncbi:MAG: hypothetical protein K2Y27_32650 [Xanthobacteraceae bacterium]|nr:hypothetical protein [Xanthobacteraceae bacterium]